MTKPCLCCHAALFVDVGENISLVESNSKCYRMDDVDHKKTGEDWLKQQIQYVGHNQN